MKRLELTQKLVNTVLRMSQSWGYSLRLTMCKALVPFMLHHGYSVVQI